MILDLLDAAPPERVYDLCVIGSGAAGTALASEFDGSGRHVLLCEAGGLDHEPPTQALYDSEVSGLRFAGVHEGRFRVHGGSTTRWGGQALPLLPSDFEARDWVPHSGWPVSFDTLAPYYARASAFLMVDDRDYDAGLFAYLRRGRAGVDAAAVWHHFSKWSPQPDLRGRYLPRWRASADVTLLLHANLTELRLRGALDRVESATFCTLTGRSTTVVAKRFVLCVGGIETARVLLANRSQRPAGLGNERGLVGRFFQDHPMMDVGRVRPADAKRFQRLFNVSQKGGLRYSTRLTATPAWQRANRTLSASAMFKFMIAEDSPVRRLKAAYTALRRDKSPRAAAADLLHALSKPGQTLYPLYRFARFGEVYTPTDDVRLLVMGEQEPNADSRVLLSEKTDALGVPRADVRWQVTDAVHRTFRLFTAELAGQFARAGLGTIEPTDWLAESFDGWREHVYDQYHHLGTARLSVSPAHGVVDPTLAVHGLPNLFVAGSAVFPTGGHSNPTLTLLALTFRLADHLRGTAE